jgi:choline dehydrogenase
LTPVSGFCTHREFVWSWLLQIPVVADLPVGENLQDQVIGDGVEMFTPYSSFTVTAARAENFLSAWAYSLFGTGL